MKRIIGHTLLLLLAAVSSPPNVEWRSTAHGDEPPARLSAVDFSRDVRPILAQHCWSCHGADETTREGSLRLDTRDAAIAPRESGGRAIVPGNVAASLVVGRIDDIDPERRMPPVDAKKPLTQAQKDVLKRWISQGADFARHWAFQAPQRPAIPAVEARAAARGPLDAFVVASLHRQGLAPSRQAARETLVRRAALDLTGLPPTPELLADFVADTGPDAYERMVDRLLASPRYAERMALQWLDAARYADTNGYNNDEERTMWPWRDWVIDAVRRQMPFDQFVVEQLAGDQLPSPSLAQKIATAFHRNHALTTEGGIIEEEYRVEYVADRVHTTASVFLGLSLQCARCHDHKYDPFTQREYYQFFAFFNQLPHYTATYARGGVAEPSVKAPTPAQQAELEGLARRQRAAETALKSREQSVDDAIQRWEAQLSADERKRLGPTDLRLHLPLDEQQGETAADHSTTPHRTATVKGRAAWVEGRLGRALDLNGQTHIDAGELGTVEADEPFTLAAWIRPTGTTAAAILSKMDDAQAFRGYDITIENGRIASHLIDHWPDNGLKVITKQPVALSAWHHVLVVYDGSRKAAGVRVYVDGKLQPLEIATDQLRGSIKTDKPFHVGRRQNSIPFTGQIDDVRVYGRALSEEDGARLADGQEIPSSGAILAIAAEQRTPSQRERLRRHYLEHVDTEYQRLKAELADLTKRQGELDKSIPAVMIMQDLEQPRPTHVLRRGQYDQPGDQVSAGIPGLFPKLPAEGPANRLALARWLVAPTHPLTARVAVNRWWEAYFGLGLVETLEDFGVTGAFPSHPDLLDWLATQLVSSGWDTLAMQRVMVTSATYRQSSDATPAALARDPKNQQLARGPRFRLSAEAVRDNALAISGLLVEQVGGPSVKPYQPDGLWEDVTVERRYKYQADAGAGLYRRSMYTFWKRTCPPPTMSTFDAPNRETCTIRRARTNTPLQALVLLNDPTYVEAARKFAERVLAERPGAGPRVTEQDDPQRLSAAYLLALGRMPNAEERTVLLNVLAESRLTFQAHPERADQLLAIGRSPRATNFPRDELAAWTIVCDMVLNLDETITKR